MTFKKSRKIWNIWSLERFRRRNLLKLLPILKEMLWSTYTMFQFMWLNLYLMEEETPRLISTWPMADYKKLLLLNQTYWDSSSSATNLLRSRPNLLKKMKIRSLIVFLMKILILIFQHPQVQDLKYKLNQNQRKKKLLPWKYNLRQRRNNKKILMRKFKKRKWFVSK